MRLYNTKTYINKWAAYCPVYVYISAYKYYIDRNGNAEHSIALHLHIYLYTYIFIAGGMHSCAYRGKGMPRGPSETQKGAY